MPCLAWGDPVQTGLRLGLLENHPTGGDRIGLQTRREFVGDRTLRGEWVLGRTPVHAVHQGLAHHPASTPVRRAATPRWSAPRRPVGGGKKSSSGESLSNSSPKTASERATFSSDRRSAAWCSRSRPSRRSRPAGARRRPSPSGPPSPGCGGSSATTRSSAVARRARIGRSSTKHRRSSASAPAVAIAMAGLRGDRLQDDRLEVARDASGRASAGGSAGFHSPGAAARSGSRRRTGG